MICPKCQEAGAKSRVTGGGGTSTAMYCPPYYDEEGQLHNHDSNILRRYYHCSEGHKFIVIGGQSCPNCDFKVPQKFEFA